MVSWRRHPPGALAQTLSNPKTWPMSKGFMGMSVDEFEEKLRSEGASERLILQEVEQFRLMKAARGGNRSHQVKERKERRKKRPVMEAMDPYVEAEIRRSAGVAADEVLEDL